MVTLPPNCTSITQDVLRSCLKRFHPKDELRIHEQLPLSRGSKDQFRHRGVQTPSYSHARKWTSTILNGCPKRVLRAVDFGINRLYVLHLAEKSQRIEIELKDTFQPRCTN
eukprot:4918975-Pyramimonas_sp.AAC.1